MKSGKWHVLQQDLKGYIHKNTLLYKQLSMACMSCMRFGTFIENTIAAALAHECGCVGSRMRLRWLTIAAALAHEYGCVGSRIRLRETIRNK